ncbi:hypothetical protein D3C72_1626550 [compost metagenome]
MQPSWVPSSFMTLNSSDRYSGIMGMAELACVTTAFSTDTRASPPRAASLARMSSTFWSRSFLAAPMDPFQ